MKTNPADMVDIDTADHEEEQIKKRRISVYSTNALKAAASVDRIYVNHRSFSQAIKALDRVFQLVREFDMQQGVVIEGLPGVGKTTIYRYFRDTLPNSNLFAKGYGIVGMRGISKPTAGHLIRALLRAYRYPFTGGGDQQLYARRGVLIDLIKQKGTRILFIDEATSILSRSTYSSAQRNETEMTDLLREIMDECSIGLVLATYSKTSALDSVDKALASRVAVQHRLDEFQCDAAWHGLVHAMVKQCASYDLSFVKDTAISKTLHQVTLGNIRQLKRLLTEAVLISVDGEKTGLDAGVLAKAFNTINGHAHDFPNAFE